MEKESFRAAVIKDGVVVNIVIVYAEDLSSAIIASETVNIGDLYDGQMFIDSAVL